MDIASGVAALIKTALALQHRQVPPSLHFREGNRHIDFANSPFFVNTRLLEWPVGESGEPRRAGVSSFGVGGTNVHLVLEEAADAEGETENDARGPQIFVISARSESALEAASVNFARHVRETTSLRGADVSHTLQVGRRAFGCRRIVVGRDLPEVADALARRDPARVWTQLAARREPAVTFLFPGQGAQVVGMGETLYRTQSVFREEVDRCARMLSPLLGGIDLRTILHPSEGEKERAKVLLDQTRYTQPALFVFGYALAKLWMSWGVRPTAMLGHSVGEYVAATLAGVFSLEDVLGLVARRAEMVQAQPGGVMLAVRLPEVEVSALLVEASSDLCIAAVNAPGLCVVAGSAEAVTAFERTLEHEQVAARRLRTSHAFHSAMMDPVVDPFTALVRSVTLHPPKIPFVSNLTGRWITDVQATDPGYWARHLREAVRFADGVGEIARAHPDGVLLEVGPGQTLAPLARQCIAKDPGSPVVVSSLQDSRDDNETIRTALGKLWLEGVKIDWATVRAGEPCRRVALPTYPFEKQRYWIEPTIDKQAPEVTDDQERPIPMPTEAAPTQPARKGKLVDKIRTVLKNLSGQDQSTAADDVSFLELGFDSLLLTQVAQAFRKEFGVKVTFRQLLEDYSTMDTLAAYLDAQIPPEPTAATAEQKVVPKALPPTNAPPTSLPRTVLEASSAPNMGQAAHGPLERVIQEQLRIMAQQLETSARPGRIRSDGFVDPRAAAVARRDRFFHAYPGVAQGRAQGVRALPSHRERGERRVHRAATGTPRCAHRAL